MTIGRFERRDQNHDLGAREMHRDARAIALDRCFACISIFACGWKPPRRRRLGDGGRYRTRTYDLVRVKHAL